MSIIGEVNRRWETQDLTHFARPDYYCTCGHIKANHENLKGHCKAVLFWRSKEDPTKPEMSHCKCASFKQADAMLLIFKRQDNANWLIERRHPYRRCFNKAEKASEKDNLCREAQGAYSWLCWKLGTRAGLSRAGFDNSRAKGSLVGNDCLHTLWAHLSAITDKANLLK